VDEPLTPRWRSIAARACSILFAIFAALSVVTTWLAAETLNSDRYVNKVSQLAADPAIQDAVAQSASTRLVDYAVGVFTDDAQEQSGNDAFSLAGLTRVASIQIIERTVGDVVRSEKFQEIWVAANRALHPQVVELLRGEQVSGVQSSEGQVVLDLAPVIVEVQARLNERGFTFLDGVSTEPGVHTLILFESEELASAQWAVDLIVTLRWMLPLLAVAALVIALILAPDRGREVIAAGLALSLTMVVVLATLAFVRDQVLDDVGAGTSAAAVQSVLDIVTGTLREGGRWVTLIGLIVAGGAYLLMPSNPIRWSIDRFVLHYRGVLYGAIVGAGCLAIILPDQPDTSTLLLVGVVAAAGVMLVWLIARTSTTPLDSSQPAT
jgi:hypothetical protein